MLYRVENGGSEFKGSFGKSLSLGSLSRVKLRRNGSGRNKRGTDLIGGRGWMDKGRWCENGHLRKESGARRLSSQQKMIKQ